MSKDEMANYIIPFIIPKDFFEKAIKWEKLNVERYQEVFQMVQKEFMRFKKKVEYEIALDYVSK